MEHLSQAEGHYGFQWKELCGSNGFQWNLLEDILDSVLPKTTGFRIVCAVTWLAV